jgi:TatD DNase family protein
MSSSICPIIDTHCHLDYIARQLAETVAARESPSEMETIDQVLARAQTAEVQWLVNPGVSLTGFSEILALADRFDPVYAALSVHPTDVLETDDAPDWLDTLKQGLDHPKVVAIGETGLDYYRPEQQESGNIALQQSCFRTLLALGRERDLPVIIHDREAHEDVLALVKEFPGVRGIMHCFSGDTAFAEAMIAQGFYISFAGNLTFKNARNLHEAARDLPLDWLLTETDAPFLSPMPFRGKPNEPERVQYVVQKMAELKNLPYADIAAVTTENAKRVFKL